jgi:hypothetical protein
MPTRIVKVATHPDLVPSEDWSQEIGKTEGSLKRDAREGRGPKRVRFGNRAYYYRQQCDEYIRRKFEDGIERSGTG